MLCSVRVIALEANCSSSTKKLPNFIILFLCWLEVNLKLCPRNSKIKINKKMNKITLFGQISLVRAGVALLFFISTLLSFSFELAVVFLVFLYYIPCLYFCSFFFIWLTCSHVCRSSNALLICTQTYTHTHSRKWEANCISSPMYFVRYEIFYLLLLLLPLTLRYIPIKCSSSLHVHI